MLYCPNPHPLPIRRTGKVSRKLRMAVRLAGSSYCPSGLLISEHIYGAQTKGKQCGSGTPTATHPGGSWDQYTGENGWLRVCVPESEIERARATRVGARVASSPHLADVQPDTQLSVMGKKHYLSRHPFSPATPSSPLTRRPVECRSYQPNTVLQS